MQFCRNCGAQLNEGASFCTQCGTPVPAPAAPEEPAVQEPVIQEPVIEEPKLDTPVPEAPPAPKTEAPQSAPAPAFAGAQGGNQRPNYAGESPYGYQQPQKRELTKEDLPKKFRPLSAWAYFGYSILFAIPLVGLIFLIIFAVGGENANVNRRSYARSYFCALLIGVIIFIVLIIFSLIFFRDVGVIFRRFDPSMYASYYM